MFTNVPTTRSVRFTTLGRCEILPHCRVEHVHRNHEPDPVDDYPEVDEEEVEGGERRVARGLAKRLHVEAPADVKMEGFAAQRIKCTAVRRAARGLAKRLHVEAPEV